MDERVTRDKGVNDIQIIRSSHKCDQRVFDNLLLL